MARKKSPPKKKAGRQSGLLECTSMYRVFVSAGIDVKGLNGSLVSMKVPANGLPNTGQIDIEVTAPEQIVAREGFGPDGTKAIFLVRLPLTSQIFKP